MGFNGDLYPSNASIVMTTKGDMVDYDTERQRLGIGSTGQVLTVASSLPTWATLTTADSVLTTQGDVLYESASGLARLGFGTSGDVLTTKGTGANPVWETPSGGGASTAIVQFQANFSTTSTTPVDITNYSLTLPTVAGSDNCFLMFDVTMARGAVSDAYQFDLIKNTTRVASNTCEPTDNGYNENLSMNTIVSADGDTLKATMNSAGGNSGTFKSNTTTINSAMTAYAV